jgi:hypothetical protein
LSVGSDELKIVVSYDLGGLGAEVGKPLLVQWRWFDSKPTLLLWIGLLMLLILPQENRKWQAWLIMIVPLLAVALRLVVASDSVSVDLMIQLIVTFAIAWAAVWLLAPYLNRGSRVRALLSALAVTAVVGTVAYLSYFGFWCSAQEAGMVICFWIVGSVSLLLGLGLSGACCRGKFHPGVLAVWLMFWLPLVTAVGMAGVFVTAILIIEGPGVGFLVQVVLSVLFASLFVSAFLYAVNLPIVFLAGMTDCYRERLRTMVHRGEVAANPFGEEARADAIPVEA